MLIVYLLWTAPSVLEAAHLLIWFNWELAAPSSFVAVSSPPGEPEGARLHRPGPEDARLHLPGLRQVESSSSRTRTADSFHLPTHQAEKEVIFIVSKLAAPLFFKMFFVLVLLFQTAPD